MVFFFFFVMKGHIWVYQTGISLSIIQSCAYITEEDSLHPGNNCIFLPRTHLLNEAFVKRRQRDAKLDVLTLRFRFTRTSYPN